MRMPAVDYRNFRPEKIREEEYAHLKLLVFWPVYGLVFLVAENWLPEGGHYAVWCLADDWIPFCEWFLIPYVFWYVYLSGMVVYTLLYDVEIFRKLMHYLILTTAAAFTVYVLIPNRQDLRPELLPGGNLLVSGVRGLYALDTPTNVCPSLHVMHAFAVSSAGIRARGLEGRGWEWFFGIATGLICLSTVFLKQHSLVDGVAGLLICVGAEGICYGGKTWVNCSEKKTA